MPNPVLVAVEDDADALRDIERELRDRYARHYRVVCMRSPARRATVSKTLRLAMTRSLWSWLGSGSRVRPEASCWMRRVTCTRRQSVAC